MPFCLFPQIDSLPKHPAYANTKGGAFYMIILSGQPVTNEQLASFQLEGQKRIILMQLQASNDTFRYRQASDLLFEVTLRSNIMNAARDLNKSGASFAIFQRSRANDAFWRVSEAGALELRYQVEPSRGIKDIFENGSQYAFECATAIVIVFYMGVLQTVGDEKFNRRLRSLTLYDWHYDTLSIYTERGNDFIYGDCLYFENPEFSYQQSQWRGENVIYLGEDQYYGHGLGILTAAEIIDKLNKRRRPGAVQSAYLLPQTTRMDVIYLRQMFGS